MLSLRPWSLSLASDVVSRSFGTSPVWLRRDPIVKKPRMPGPERAKIVALSKPHYTERHPDTRDLWRECPRVTNPKIETKQDFLPNDYEKLFVKEFQNYLESSKVIAVFHSNHLRYLPHRRAYQDARRASYELKGYSYAIGKAALEGTKWQCLMHFFDTNVFYFEQWLAFSEEVNIAKLLRFEKKAPELFLCGAIVEDRFLNKQQLVDYSNLPSIDYLRGELCSILNMPVQKTVSLLGSNQSTLSRNLEQYIKDQNK